YMVIAALAWSLKAWLALVQPRAADRQALLAMGFKRFLQEVVLLPCQVARASRRLLYRLVPRDPRVGPVWRGGGGAGRAPLPLRPGNRCRGPDASIRSGAKPKKGTPA